MVKATAPTLDDVAARAGVSTATVSRCLNTPDRVRATTRARVEEAIQALGYTPHFGGRALASNRTNTFGAVIPTMENAIFARGIQAVQEELAANHVTLLIASSGYDPDREQAQIQTLLARGVDGLLLIGEARPEETYTFLQRRAVPFVLVWTLRPGCPHTCVGFDNRAAARDLAQAVLARGHREIAMIAGRTLWNDRAKARVDGVREALEAAGLAFGEDKLIEADYLLEAGSVAFAKLMETERRPTAVICGNDVLAAGALIAARRAGLSVPQDVSIVGFDDIDLAEAVHPPLTTVHVPHRRMGAAAAQALLALREGAGAPQDLEFTTFLVERESLGAPPNATD